MLQSSTLYFVLPGGVGALHGTRVREYVFGILTIGGWELYYLLRSIQTFFIAVLLVVSSVASAERITPSDRVVNYVKVQDPASNGTEIDQLRPGQFADLLSAER